jgi:hypothetical protein
MTTIIAGGFQIHDDALAACERLAAEGVRAENIFTFHVNPPGAHDATPIGGDRDESPGAKKADKGAVKGAVIGAAAGAAAGAVATPLVGPVAIAAGAGVGAYTGSLVGAMSATDKRTHADELRPAETMVAVNADAAGIPGERIAEILAACNAQQVERAEGRWENGEWIDFDPVSRPQLIHSDRRDQPTAPPAA